MSRFEANTFQVPNILIDEIMLTISPKSFACLVFIIRKTKGWNKEQDKISNSQLSKVLRTKDNRTISKITKELEDNKLIHIHRENGRINEYSLTNMFKKPPTKNVGAKNDTTHKKCMTPPTKNVGTTTHKKCSTTKDTIKTTITIKEIYKENLNLDAFNSYIEYRKENRYKKLKQSSVNLLIEDLIKLDHEQQSQCIKQTIKNGWQGLFPEKFEVQNANNYQTASEQARANEAYWAAQEQATYN